MGGGCSLIVRKILLENDPLIRKRMPYITPEKWRSDGIRIIKDLWDTLRDCDAVGFAANQIDEPYRICIIKPDIVLINPEFLSRKGKEYFKEGCMSIPGYYAAIPRSVKIKVRVDFPRRTVVLLGNVADIAQHEIDHLDGILIRDYVEKTHGKKGGILIAEHDKNMQSYIYNQ